MDGRSPGTYNPAAYIPSASKCWIPNKKRVKFWHME